MNVTHSEPTPSWSTLQDSGNNAGPSTAPPPTNTSAAQGVHRLPTKRLPKEGYIILRDFYTHVTHRPSKEDRINLAIQIRKTVHGCEDYSPKDVAGYFTRKRQTEQKHKGQEAEDSATPVATTADIMYPSLRDPTTVHKLNVLLRDDPEPTSETAAIWAKHLGGEVPAQAPHILIYAKLRKAQSAKNQLLASPSPVPGVPQLSRSQPFRQSSASQLPTPAASTSPEPRSPSIKEEDELESDDEMGDMEMETPEPEDKPTYQIPFDSGLHAVLERTLAEPIPFGDAPKTFADLGRWCQRQQATSAPFLEEVSNGKYAHLGLGNPPPPRAL